MKNDERFGFTPPSSDLLFLPLIFEVYLFLFFSTGVDKKKEFRID